MLRELEWMHRLHISYDASTFDTDPFEPQPDAAGTIFPYWITSPSGAPAHDGQIPGDSLGRRNGQRASDPGTGLVSGFVELPYTLPQDSTVYLVLRESSPEIWIRKTDWIAGQGGMVLLNTHPDYLRVDEAPSDRTYPAEYYIQLLTYIRRQYGGAYWHPLPGQLAEWVHQLRPRPVLVSGGVESGPTGLAALRPALATLLGPRRTAGSNEGLLAYKRHWGAVERELPIRRS